MAKGDSYFGTDVCLTDGILGKVLLRRSSSIKLYILYDQVRNQGSDVLFGCEVALKTVILVHSCCHNYDNLDHRYYDQLLVHALCLLEVVVRQYITLTLHLAVRFHCLAYFVSCLIGALKILFF